MSEARPRGSAHFEYVVGKLEEAGARYFNGEDWFCPGHDDGNRGSLGIREISNGSIVMYCQGGCENKDLFRLAGLDYPKDFYPTSKRIRYIYRDEDGNPVYAVDRYYRDGKKRLNHRVYAPEHPKADAKGFAAYAGCMRGVRRLLYRLPMIRKVIAAGKPIYVCAGEKDAKAMHAAYRVAATTASAGEAKAWDAGLTEQLRGARRVYVVADRDPAGEKRAANVYDELSAEGFDVRILFPHVNIAKGDAADHIAEGWSLGDFERIEREDLAVKPDLFRFEVSDAGNAERVSEIFGPRLRFIQKHRIWVVWDGTRWAEDNAAAERMALSAVRAYKKDIREEMAAEESEARLKYLGGLERFAVSSENSSRLLAALRVASSFEEFSTMPRDYDTDPWLFNVLNGTVNLHTGELLAHDRSHMIRRMAPVEYDPNAECPRWIEFTQRVIPSKPVRRLCRMLAGYFLTGDTRESLFPVLYGKGRNGKSTFTNTLKEMMGDYAQTLPNDTLVKKNNSNIPSDIARLEGARMALAMEFPEGKGIDEALIKSLTGNEEITARFLGKDFFEFRPQAKLVLGTNYKPDIRGADDGLWRRMLLIPFTQYIEDSEVDKELQEKLLAELPGILNWALDGLADWLRNGIVVPEEIRNANMEYREDSDTIGQFIEEMCSTPEDGGVLEDYWEYSRTLHEAFNIWMEENGSKPWSKRAFGGALSDRRGIERDRLSGSQSSGKRDRIYRGIRLKNANDD